MKQRRSWDSTAPNSVFSIMNGLSTHGGLGTLFAYTYLHMAIQHGLFSLVVFFRELCVISNEQASKGEDGLMSFVLEEGVVIVESSECLENSEWLVGPEFLAELETMDLFGLLMELEELEEHALIRV